MKIKTMLLLWLLFGSLSFALAQGPYPNLTFAPTHPQPGKSVKFTYDPKGTELAGKKVEAVAYVYANQKMVALDVPLTQAKGSWKGTIPTTSESTSFFLFFSADEAYDNNQGKGYAFMLYDSKKSPVKGAWGSLANAQIGPVYLMKMERNTNDALANLEKEFSRFPENKRTFMQAYVSVLSAEKEEQAQTLILKELDAMAQAPDLTAEELASLSFLYRRNKQEEKANQMAEKAKQLDPNGFLAQQELLDPFFQEKDLTKKQAIAEDFFSRFPDNEQAAEWIQGALAQEMVKQEQYDQFKAYLINNPKVAKWHVYNEAAWSMVVADKELALAHDFAAKGYDMAKKELVAPTGKKPEWLTEKQWQENRQKNVGMVGDTWGYILLKQGKLAEALPLLEEAVELHKEQDVEMNERYMDALMKNGKTEKAKTSLEGYISTGRSTSKMKEYLREAYIKERGSENGFGAYLAKLEAPALEKMRAEIQKKLISEPAPAFALQDLRGKQVSLADLKGKTVIVDFWATWCGPCVKSFPSMQQAVNKYKDDDQVAFVFINSWENGEDKQKAVGDFIAKKNYTFDVLMDTENKTIGDYKVEGIPTKFVIDKNGNIRYRSVGFGGNEEAVVTELSMLIDMLR